MIAIERIPATGKVVVVALRRQHVVVPIVDAAERDRRPPVITFGRVVQHDVQDDLDSRPCSSLIRFFTSSTCMPKLPVAA